MTEAVESDQTRYYLRFTLNERLQHAVLAACVTVLIVTGMPARYADSAASETVIHALGGFGLRGLIHRAAALMLLLVGLYHLGYLIFSPNGRRELREILPGRSDLRGFVAMMGYYLSRRRDRPAFGRFSYIEKVQYWVAFSGMIVMALTGATLWASQWSPLALPKPLIDLSRVVHSYEGLLVFLCVIIWHFYHVHLGARVFPMSWTWVDGLVEESRLAEEHPLEYEQIRDDPTRWIIGPDRAKLAVSAMVTERTTARMPVRVGSVITAVLGGVLTGLATPVFLTPLLALIVWLLSPDASPFGAALLAVSLVLVPSTVLGGCLATALVLRGNPVRDCILMTLTGLGGLFLGMVSVWTPFAAGVYVVRWFLPIPLVAGALMIAAVVLSIAVGLLGVILGVVRGRSMGARLFESPPHPSGGEADTGEQPGRPSDR